MPTLYNRIQGRNLDRLAGLSDFQRNELRSIPTAALPKK